MLETPSRHEPPGLGRGPRGVTLTELLVASALALVVMGAVASLFGLFGRSVKQSQATMNLGSLMRSAAWQLRQDLAGVTCPVVPWLAPETNAGYFELIEGPTRDTTKAVDAQGQPTDDLTADTDDILAFTTQSLVNAFVGRFVGETIESPYAEVAWFCRPAQAQPVAGTTLYDLHRRQCLVVNYPDLTHQLDQLLAKNAPDQLVAMGLLDEARKHEALSVLIELLKKSNPNDNDMLRYFSISALWDFVNLTRDDISSINLGKIPPLRDTSLTGPLPKATESDLSQLLRNLGLLTLLESLPTNGLPIVTNRTACDLSLQKGRITVTATNAATGATVLTTGTYLIPNLLGDLTKRENRFMRGDHSFEVMTETIATRGISSGTAGRFPFWLPTVSSTMQSSSGVTLVPLVTPQATFADTTREAEDVILTNVISFDVRVFDPRAIVTGTGGNVERVPGDFGYVAAETPQTGEGMGAYVDLGWGGGTPAVRTATFPPAGKTAIQSPGLAVTDAPRRLTLPSATYDTWSRHYEFNGLDDDGDGVVDEGVHGVDTDGDTWPELTGEAETSPPYPVPLRGLEVRIRCYEPASRQVRQITIRHSFTR